MHQLVNRTFRSVLIGFFLIWAFSQFAHSQGTVNHEYPDWMYQKRMDALNSQSPILFEYNENVRAYIDVYMVKRRSHFQNILNRSQLYFPIFEEYLDKYNLPLELKYLAVVESALDPKAKSSSGAMGLWQFLLNAGKMFDLNVTTFTDDRSDVRKSTEAACKYLQYLYTTLGDWQLALAAYNGGVGEVQRAMQKSGKKNYWELRPFLTEQMRGYVPAFMAAAYALTNYDKHGFVFNAVELITYNDVDSISLQKPSSLSKLASVLNIDVAILSNLNPIYTKDYIPVFDSPVVVYVPKKCIPLFEKNETQLYSFIYKNQIYKSSLLQVTQLSAPKIKRVHTVSDGEYYHKIAMTYSCSVADIMSWNKMKKKSLYAGQKLVIWQSTKPQSPFFFAVNEVRNEDFIFLNESKGGIKTSSHDGPINDIYNPSETFIK